MEREDDKKIEEQTFVEDTADDDVPNGTLLSDEGSSDEELSDSAALTDEVPDDDESSGDDVKPERDGNVESTDMSSDDDVKPERDGDVESTDMSDEVPSAVEEYERELELRISDPSRPDMKWYVVHTLTGHEKKVKSSIERTVVDRGLEEYILEVMVPQEEITTNTKKGKKTRKKVFFPGYIMIRMEINEVSWALVRGTAGVTGFVTAGTRNASPLSNDEIRIILDQIAGRKPDMQFEIDMGVGDPVRITSGPFASFNGIVEEVMADRGKLKVQVTVFGRATSVELEISQVDEAI